MTSQRSLLPRLSCCFDHLPLSSFRFYFPNIVTIKHFTLCHHPFLFGLLRSAPPLYILCGNRRSISSHRGLCCHCLLSNCQDATTHPQYRWRTISESSPGIALASSSLHNTLLCVVFCSWCLLWKNPCPAQELGNHQAAVHDFHCCLICEFANPSYSPFHLPFRR